MATHTQEKTVYILLTRSGTWFSRLIHLATSDCYTHASIGLDGPAGPFYSFARKYPHTALPAGLVMESPRSGFLSRHPGLPCRLYTLSVRPETYLRLRRRLNDMYAQREQYHYNLLGALSCFFQLPLARRNHYFCSQFVALLLRQCGALSLNKDPALTRPADFCALRQLRPVHQGAVGSLSAAAAAG